MIKKVKQLCSSRLLRLMPAAIAAIFLAAALLAVPETAAQGVRSGLLLCAQVVIPSLFPFLALSAFLIRSGLSGWIGRLFEPITRLLFRLPGEAAGVILMSAVGGFPVGPRMTAQLLERGLLTENEAQRMLFFCINAGPAFVVGAVGSAMLGSTRAGAVLYAALLLSSLLMGLCVRFCSESGQAAQIPAKKGAPSQPSLADAFVESTADAASSMFSICAWVVLFTCITSLVRLLPLPEGAFPAISGVLEVTSGCAATAGRAALPVLAAVLGWTGLSVQCQVLPFVRKTGMKPSLFLASRAVCAGLSACLCHGLLYIIPCELSVFSSFSNPVAASSAVSIPAAAGLMLMGVLLILEVDIKRKTC